MPQGTQAMMQFFPIIAIFLVFYFLVLAPQKKQEKERQKMLSGVSKNDDIVTTGGIHGTIVNVKDKTVILRVDENVKMEIEKSSIGFVKKSPSAGAESIEKK